MMQLQLDAGGFDCGPLFAPVAKVRQNPRLRMSGGAEVWVKYRRARPIWQDAAGLRAKWKESSRLTADTGIQHSVDHIVPLVHPLVCGLHCEANIQIISLAENIRKSNNWWPGMWGEQRKLL